jgi:hypothetical protein
MLRRLRIYFTGFGIGLVLVYVIFGRDDSRDLDIWTPSQRVLEEIRNDTSFQSSERLACYANCLHLDTSRLAALWKDSEVKSLNPGGNPYIYLITLKSDSSLIEAEITRDNRGMELKFIRDNQNPVSCACP